MYKCPWYNTTISIKLNGQIFEDYFKTGREVRYELMCDVYAYYKGMYQFLMMQWMWKSNAKYVI